MNLDDKEYANVQLMKKKIPVGLSNYRRLKIENYYVVDKSMLIKEFLDSACVVTLITRPRRFHRNSVDTFGIRQEARQKRVKR